jgi:hypothetical protein
MFRSVPGVLQQLTEILFVVDQLVEKHLRGLWGRGFSREIKPIKNGAFSP